MHSLLNVIDSNGWFTIVLYWLQNIIAFLCCAAFRASTYLKNLSNHDSFNNEAYSISIITITTMLRPRGEWGVDPTQL